ncbi:MAG: hypothetical protein ACK47M_21270 [Caldilinea sp.]
MKQPPVQVRPDLLQHLLPDPATCAGNLIEAHSPLWLCSVIVNVSGGCVLTIGGVNQIGRILPVN